MKTETEQVSEQLSLKEYLLQGYSYFQYLLRNWVFLLIAVVIGTAYGVYKSKTTLTTYTAALTFMVNEDDGGSFLGAGELLNQFGLGGGGSSEYNLDKISALAVSRRIVSAALLDSVVVKDVSDLLANHLIREYALQEKWNEEEDSPLKDFMFSTVDAAQFSKLENAVVKSLHGMVVGSERPASGLVEISYVPETGIMLIASTTSNEEISLALSERLYDYLSQFYVEEATQKQLVTLQNLSSRLDSVGEELSKTEYRLATAMDKATGIYSQKDQMGIGRLSRQVQYLSLLYGEITTRKETTDFMLKNATPFFQIVDEPLLPLQPVRTSLIKSLFYGNFFAGITVVVLLLGYKSLRDVLQ